MTGWLIVCLFVFSFLWLNDNWMIGWVFVWLDGWLIGCKYGWVDGWMDGWMDGGCMYIWMHGCWLLERKRDGNDCVWNYTIAIRTFQHGLEHVLG